MIKYKTHVIPKHKDTEVEDVIRISYHTNTVMVIWRQSNLTGVGRPQEHLHALLKARAGLLSLV